MRRCGAIGPDGVPQPNPVGFLWDGHDSLLAYSQANAKRLGNIRRQPLVSLDFDSNGGEDIVVLIGTAEIRDGHASVPENPGWLEKYGEAFEARFGGAARFADRFCLPMCIELIRVRGF